jgi:hypothetical protein
VYTYCDKGTRIDVKAPNLDSIKDNILKVPKVKTSTEPISISKSDLFESAIE